MKMLSVFLGASLLLLPISGNAHSSSSHSTDSMYSSSTSVGKKIGDYLMLGLGPKNSVALSNNLYYKPTRKKEAKLVYNWQLNDSIRLLRSKDKHRYVLLNLRTGESVKTKIYSWG